MATLRYYPAVVQLLAESGADLNIQNEVSYTLVVFHSVSKSLHIRRDLLLWWLLWGVAGLISQTFYWSKAAMWIFRRLWVHQWPLHTLYYTSSYTTPCVNHHNNLCVLTIHNFFEMCKTWLVYSLIGICIMYNVIQAWYELSLTLPLPPRLLVGPRCSSQLRTKMWLPLICCSKLEPTFSWKTMSVSSTYIVTMSLLLLYCIVCVILSRATELHWI